ncbi:hypothetical protein SALBM311S_08589 [Streptomyces alboniger]
MGAATRCCSILENGLSAWRILFSAERTVVRTTLAQVEL